MLELILAALLLGNPVSARDTIFELRRGDRLVLNDLSGEVQVIGWDRDVMEAQADADETTGFEFRRSGSQVTIRVLDRKNRDRMEDIHLRVPRWLDLELSGKRVEGQFRGLEGTLRIRSLHSELELEDLRGQTEITMTSGEISARELNGPARLKTGSGDLTVTESAGALNLETVSGDIDLTDLRSPSVSARTTSGEIGFNGRLLPDGEYKFQTHSGDITLGLAEPVNSQVSVLAYEGDFESDFPIRTRGFTSGQEITFTLGSGGARLILQAFGGEISLLRGGSS